jgi:hypothetical protein
VKDVLKRVEEKGEASLTQSQRYLYEEYKNYLSFIDSDAYKNSLNQKELLLSYIENEQKAVRIVKRKVIYDFSRLVFSVFLSKMEIDEAVAALADKNLSALDKALTALVKDGVAPMQYPTHEFSNPDARARLVEREAYPRELVTYQLQPRYTFFGSVGQQTVIGSYELLISPAALERVQASLVRHIAHERGAFDQTNGTVLRVTRRGWNGKDMWLALRVAETDAPPKRSSQPMTLPFIYMCTADKKYVPWLCSQTDLLAEDWEEVA